ncbi:RNA polymerase sigma-70 factor, ECF subfamily [Pedobacter westerhofensis]|uniref:RNA polymerase sigma-70 factor, ECF subfamily n=1 Tax=Pedobacter westerhofensis TaxID=425512 RepID=A0A521FDT8_9SPHI|nr:sigma-70 family RNA polymerase sigma factor [Pedobacter westerhofensis]SMO93791.1 RNA polymerase sigma-70 factor, ECF subfamily [Pedobacter westerhofensis]
METATRTDQELLGLLREDDKAAFGELYHKYANRLYLQAFKMLKDDVQSKDVIQEVFLQLWSKRGTQQIESLNAYLYAITRFQVFKVLRSGKNHTDIFEVEHELPLCRNTEYALAEREVSTAFFSGLSELPEKCRTIFTLSRVECLTNREISLQLSISPKTVENQITIAIRKLRTGLSDFLPVFFIVFLCCCK